MARRARARGGGRARGKARGGTGRGAQSGTTEPLPSVSDPGTDAYTTLTNDDQSRVEHQDHPKPDPADYESLPTTSTTGFLTLHIPQVKYRELFHSCDSIKEIGTLIPLEKHTNFLTFTYDPKKYRPKDNRGQEEHFEDSAVDLATPGTDPATTQPDADQDILPTLTGDSLPSLAAVLAQQNNPIAQSEQTQSTRGDLTGFVLSLDQNPAPNTLDPDPYQSSRSLRDFTVQETSRQASESGQPTTASGAAGPRTKKKSKVVRLNLPLGYHLDENMQPVHDPNDVSGILKGVVDDLYDVQSKTHGFIPETQNLLIDKIGDISEKLARLKDVTDSNISPNNPIHNVRIAPEIVDYVDEGRNPDIFTREFVENVQRGNAVINGKKQGLRDFSVILAQKMKEGLPGVDGHVDRIMQNAGLEKELAEAEGKAMEKRKASGGEVINNGGS